MSRSTSEERPESLVAYLERAIASSIARGERPPRSRLSPTALASEYEVSHIPVREALSSLSAKGHIDYQQSRGYFTRTLSSRELSDIYHWREILETEALKIAFPLITPDDISKMRGIVDEEAGYLAAERQFDYLRTNRAFHFVAFDRVGSGVLLHLLNYLWDISRPYWAAEAIESSVGHNDHKFQIEIFQSGTLEEMLDNMKEHRGHRVGLIQQTEADKPN